jgi:hypothetical protein
MASPNSSGRLVPFIGLAWFLVVLALGASGQLTRLRPPAPQAVLLGLTVVLIVAGMTLQGFRQWLAGINLRQLVAFHIFRFVGFYFLVLYARGELPYAFAVPGGWGDIGVATGALLLVLLVPDLGARRPWVMAWNILGLLDIVYVVLTASRLAFANPDSMQALLRLPLSLLPTYFVPLIIASHLYLLRRLRLEPARLTK